MKRNAIFGGVVWTAVAAAVAMRIAHLTTIELLFLLAPLVVVPLGLELRVRVVPEHEFLPLERAVWKLQLPAALCVAASFWIPPGRAAVLLVAPWFFVGCLAGVIAARDFLRGGFKSLDSTCTIMSFLYLLVGCTWLVASRLEMTPMGFQEPIVLLTAVHFHFAGFAAPLLALAVRSKLKMGNTAARSFYNVITTGVLAGPGLLAAGFVIGPRTKLAMALTVACSEAGLALYFLAAIRNLRPRLAQTFVAISAASALVAMVLATAWAIGEFPLQPFVHLDEMARYHGTANGLGFILCGLVGWTLASAGATGGKRGEP
jgi:YndJ-like protein